ncbi:MAG: phytanoyl-CoA dioxygenase family protein [Planctomycetota bacterium]|nr:phytanoyl-CoA dioxygenase family protein [Planctomycetota bacterium]MDA1139134.1 phytanoyl-CoA dioxygenase family protein [Planctomycetota bacterium]
MPTEQDNYLFDLRGFLVMESAVSAGMLQRLNDAIDKIPPLEPGEWYGNVMRQRHPENRGKNIQNVHELGGVFEELLDHPAWFDHAGAYLGKSDGISVTEYFVNIRGQGGAINIHSGGHMHLTRTQYAYQNGKFHCGEINILLALTDIGPGDGATVVVPGSHKSNFEHPVFKAGYRNLMKDSSDGVLAAEEVYLKAGDAGLFVDSLCHGAVARKNPGERRVIIIRYCPKWSRNYHGFVPSEEMLARLTPERRVLVKPQNELRRPDSGIRTQDSGQSY